MPHSCSLETRPLTSPCIQDAPVLHLPLGGKRGAGKFAIVLDDEFSRTVLATRRWHLLGRYIARNTPRDPPRSRWQGRISLHRLVFEHYHGPIPADKEVDHINRNRLDNRPSNLRAVTHSQNGANVGRRKNNTSGFGGVHWCKQKNKWRAKLTVQGSRIHLGLFLCPRKAADAVNNAYQRFFPGIAVPNP